MAVSASGTHRLIERTRKGTCMAQQPSELPAFPMERDAECPFKLPEEYEELRENNRVARVALAEGVECRLVTRYEDVRTVTRNTRFSSVQRDARFPEVFKGRIG